MPGGFFDIEDTQVVRGDEATAAAKRAAGSSMVVANCDTCGLSTKCLSPRMKPTGEGRRRVLIVAEAPGKEEDRQGVQLVGQSGQLLRGMLDGMGLDLDRDFWKTNALCCRLEDNADPEGIQLAACRKRLLATVERLKPVAIVALGKFAVMGLFGHRLTGDKFSGLTMTDWAGAEIPYEGRWVLPTWHPAYLLRTHDPVIEKQLRGSLQRAMKLAEGPAAPERDYLADCHPLLSVSDAVECVKGFMGAGRPIAFDYETTGKKPHRTGHRILSAGISDGRTAFAFPMFEDPDFLYIWKQFLTDPSIEKTAHHAKFEMLWTRVILGYWPVNVNYDTMLGAHSEHNRRRANLKFQTFLNFGVVGYDDVVEPYMDTLKAEEALNGANGFNAVNEVPIMDLLKYNAADGLFTALLREKQERTLTDSQLIGVRFFSSAGLCMARAEHNGIRLDLPGADALRVELTERMDRIERRVLSLPELTQWDRKKPFRLSAPGDLTHLLFDIMKFPAQETTATGRPKGDKVSLEKYDVPVVKKVLEWRKWQKLRDTYLAGFTREAVDGVIHPFFNLHTTDTFRSSSDSPNFQNVPKRNKEASSRIRSILRPMEGQRLVEYDYKAIEVCIAACYNKDPNLIRYIEDPSTDMHRDMAAELFLREPGAVSKEERSVAKNGFVFPAFYGSYYEQMAPDLWDKFPAGTREHLAGQGIKSLKAFIRHVEEIEELFWGERFPVYAEWKEKTYADYQKVGYIETFTGFRYYGPMKRNEVINYRVQGTAFHCLLWTFGKVMAAMNRAGMRSRLCGQIHDAAVGSVDPAEERDVDELMWRFGTQRIRQYWPEIIVPLSIEKARSEIDGSWAVMSDCGLLNGGI